MTDVLHVLDAGGADIDLPQLGAQRGNELQRILIRPVGGAEAGHGDAEDVLGRILKQLHRFRCHQQGKGRVKPAGNADHRPF